MIRAVLENMLWRIVVAWDVIIGIVLFHKVQTISTTAAQACAEKRQWGCKLCGILNRVNPGHCEDALRNPLGPLGD